MNIPQKAIDAVAEQLRGDHPPVDKAAIWADGYDKGVATERARIRELAETTGAVCTDEREHVLLFADLIGISALGRHQ